MRSTPVCAQRATGTMEGAAMVRRSALRPLLALVSLLVALTPAVALADRPGLGQPFGIDWTPIVFWAIVGGVITGGFVLGILIDWGNR